MEDRAGGISWVEVRKEYVRPKEQCPKPQSCRGIAVCVGNMKPSVFRRGRHEADGMQLERQQAGRGSPEAMQRSVDFWS